MCNVGFESSVDMRECIGRSAKHCFVQSHVPFAGKERQREREVDR